jgi:type I restriction enzyme S subunit
MNEIAFQELLLDARPGESISGLRKLILAAALRGDFDDQKERQRQLSVVLNSIQALPASNKTNRTRLRTDSSEVNSAEDLPLVSNEFVVELGTMATIEKGKTGIKDAIPGEYPLVVTAEGRLTTDHFDFEGPAVVIPLVSSTGHGDASLKRIHYQEGKYAVGSILCAVQSRFPELVHPRYLYEYLSTFKEELLVSRMSGTANVSLTVGKIAEVPVPLITYEAQEKLDRLMSLCDALEAQGQLEAEQHTRLVSTLFGSLLQSDTPEALADNWQRIATHFDLLLDRPEAVDALEQTILQLAVRGLLVPQDPTDEPASVLLQKIRTEKDHLIAQGKIKRDKPLPPITDEEKPFELPRGWEWVRWADVAMKIGDIDHKMPTEVKDGVPYVSPRDFYAENSIDFEGAKKISIEDFKELASKIRPQVGDLIYPRYGTIGVVRKVVDDRDFLASYSCAVIKAMHGFVEPDYQHLFSISGCAKDQASAATNKTTQPNVGLKSIQSFAMPLPPLAEQSRIVTRVNELRLLCTNLCERLKKTRSVQSHLADALVGN